MAWSWTKLNSTFRQRAFSLSTLSSFFLPFPWLPPLLGWEVIADDGKKIECQGSIPRNAIASGMNDYKQGHTLPGTIIKAKQTIQREQVLTVCRPILHRLTGQSQKNGCLYPSCPLLVPQVKGFYIGVLISHPSLLF